MSDILFDNMFINNGNNNNSNMLDSSQMTLWMGDLDPWMDENFIKQVWLSLGENVVVKLIRDKRTGISAGYAFIGFSSTQSAQRALNTIHGSKIPNSQRTFRLNWASGGGILDRKEDRAPEYSLFVGDLSSEIDETFLLGMFRSNYPSCHSAKIMTDPLSGQSRGYGFVRFSDQNEQQDAVLSMNGLLCNGRPIRVSFATPKNNHSTTRYLQLALQAPALIQQPTNPNNTTVFVGGLSSPVSEEELRHYFSPFGEVSYVKIPPGKGCGFVQYVTRASAEQAIERMNGFVIGSSRIRLSWGRSQADKMPSSVNNNFMMSPTMTSSTTISTNNNTTNAANATLFGSFRPLSPPIQHQHQQQQPFYLNQHQLQQHHYAQQQQDIGHYSNNRSLFQSEDDWLNGTAAATTAANHHQFNNSHLMNYDLNNDVNSRQEDWQRMNGISYA